MTPVNLETVRDLSGELADDHPEGGFFVEAFGDRAVLGTVGQLAKMLQEELQKGMQVRNGYLKAVWLEIFGPVF